MLFANKKFLLSVKFGGDDPIMNYVMPAIQQTNNNVMLFQLFLHGFPVEWKLAFLLSDSGYYKMERALVGDLSVLAKQNAEEMNIEKKYFKNIDIQKAATNRVKIMYPKFPVGGYSCDPRLYRIDIDLTVFGIITGVDRLLSVVTDSFKVDEVLIRGTKKKFNNNLLHAYWPIVYFYLRHNVGVDLANVANAQFFLTTVRGGLLGLCKHSLMTDSKTQGNASKDDLNAYLKSVTNAANVCLQSHVDTITELTNTRRDLVPLTYKLFAESGYYDNDEKSAVKTSDVASYLKELSDAYEQNDKADWPLIKSVLFDVIIPNLRRTTIRT